MNTLPENTVNKLVVQSCSSLVMSIDEGTDVTVNLTQTDLFGQEINNKQESDRTEQTTYHMIFINR